MDVYHKILIKLYEVTGGSDSKKVDFADLLKKEGFLPSYPDIHKQMSQSGWITDAGRAKTVYITHWGAMEAKKSLSGSGDPRKDLAKEANRLKSNVKEFLVMTEEFTSDLSLETLKPMERKFKELKSAIDKLKSSL